MNAAPPVAAWSLSHEMMVNLMVNANEMMSIWLSKGNCSHRVNEDSGFVCTEQAKPARDPLEALLIRSFRTLEFGRMESVFETPQTGCAAVCGGSDIEIIYSNSSVPKKCTRQSYKV